MIIAASTEVAAIKTRLLLCALATVTACGRDTTGPGVPTGLTPVPPLAGLRYLNLVNDTSAVDFRIINLLAYAPNASAASFRTGGSPYGVPADSLPFSLPVEAGVSAHIRVSPNSTDPVVAAQILFDTSLVFTAGANYTFFLYGQARAAHLRALVTVDTLPAPAGAAYRVVNLGGAGVGGTDVYIVAQAAVAPLTGVPTFALVADGAVTGYVNVAVNPAYQAVALAPATQSPFRFFANVPVGSVGTPTVNPIAGSNVAGTGISAVIVPRPVLNSRAQTGCGTPAGCLASDTLPRFLFLIDTKPPPTAP